MALVHSKAVEEIKVMGQDNEASGWHICSRRMHGMGYRCETARHCVTITCHNLSRVDSILVSLSCDSRTM